MSQMRSLLPTVKPRTVILVSPDADIRQRLTDCLQSMRWTVYGVSGGAEAMGLLQEHAPEAMIVDGWLPDLDPAEFMEHAAGLCPGMDLLHMDGMVHPQGQRSVRRNELQHALRSVSDDAAAGSRDAVIQGNGQESNHGRAQENVAWQPPEPMHAHAEPLAASSAAAAFHAAFTAFTPTAPGGAEDRVSPGAWVRGSSEAAPEDDAVYVSTPQAAWAAATPGEEAYGYGGQRSARPMAELKDLSHKLPVPHSVLVPHSVSLPASVFASPVLHVASPVPFPLPLSPAGPDLSLPSAAATHTAEVRMHLPELVGDSQGMRELARLIRLVAGHRASVLIQGETGTGKELVAKAVHRLSPRAGKPFAVLNCAAIPEHLLEAELFGHTRGAFTGAVTSRTGRIEAAHGGTLFLDEIGEMPLPLQAKMLRFLESGEIQKVGENDVSRVDVRIVAATHQPLEKRSGERTFRLDLYYRLAVFPVDVPALRDRSDDIPMLVEHFLRRIGEDSPRCSIEAGAVATLARHTWPGNVRQLGHAMQRACILAGATQRIGREHFHFTES